MRLDKIRVVELKQTCEACPSQWVGKDEFSRKVYIRYRWGFLSADVGDQDVFCKQIGDDLHGVLLEEDMREELKEVFSFEC